MKEPELKVIFMEALRLYVLEELECEREGYNYEYEVVTFSDLEGYPVRLKFNFSQKVEDEDFRNNTKTASQILYFMLYFDKKVKEEVEFKFSFTDEGI